jgi:hypothetical protein
MAIKEGAVGQLLVGKVIAKLNAIAAETRCKIDCPSSDKLGHCAA